MSPLPHADGDGDRLAPARSDFVGSRGPVGPAPATRPCPTRSRPNELKPPARLVSECRHGAPSQTPGGVAERRHRLRCHSRRTSCGNSAGSWRDAVRASGGRPEDGV